MYLNFGIAFRGMFPSRFKYRDRSTIIGHILNSISRDPKGKTKTSIMRSANLNFDQTNKYLDFLLVCDIVKATNPIRSQEMARYKLTGKGTGVLRNFEMLQLALQTFQKAT